MEVQEVQAIPEVHQVAVQAVRQAAVPAAFQADRVILLLRNRPLIFGANV